MTTYIDKKFINRVSPTLRNFKWKKETLANCSCPICGDSQKNQRKARGFFYQKGNDFFYKCHNCGAGHNLYNFLNQVAPSLCKEYSLERFRGGETGKSNSKLLTLANGSKLSANGSIQPSTIGIHESLSTFANSL